MFLLVHSNTHATVISKFVLIFKCVWGGEALQVFCLDTREDAKHFISIRGERLERHVDDQMSRMNKTNI